MAESNPKISVLVSARKNSKYLAKFLFGYFQNTAHPEDLEILVCLNAGDTWNKELVDFFNGRVTFVYEDLGLGRAGLHEYFNILAGQATGDWLIYFCEDHFINYPGHDLHAQAWDDYFLQNAEVLKLDPREPYVFVPKFDNAGSMNHLISRGFYEVLGHKMGRHGWIDSYLNDVMAMAWGKNYERIIRLDKEVFHDFTHDQPTPMDEANMRVLPSPAAANLPKHGSSEYLALAQEDATKLRQATEGK